ncbi:unnamed protein product [Caenorhabditis auriculariae]|uniref:Uncharacterized protein n=1 Tax=Caenorhabditis auriculariae TaxID=2777116 RepID=A0A8S1HII6_9PELO|nr:unnamed protein product [Caenorhabditis auriculariae]
MGLNSASSFSEDFNTTTVHEELRYIVDRIVDNLQFTSIEWRAQKKLAIILGDYMGSMCEKLNLLVDGTDLRGSLFANVKGLIEKQRVDVPELQEYMRQVRPFPANYEVVLPCCSFRNPKKAGNNPIVVQQRKEEVVPQLIPDRNNLIPNFEGLDEIKLGFRKVVPLEELELQNKKMDVQKTASSNLSYPALKEDRETVKREPFFAKPSLPTFQKETSVATPKKFSENRKREAATDFGDVMAPQKKMFRPHCTQSQEPRMEEFIGARRKAEIKTVHKVAHLASTPHRKASSSSKSVESMSSANCKSLPLKKKFEFRFEPAARASEGAQNLETTAKTPLGKILLKVNRNENGEVETVEKLQSTTFYQSSVTGEVQRSVVRYSYPLSLPRKSVRALSNRKSIQKPGLKLKIKTGSADSAHLSLFFSAFLLLDIPRTLASLIVRACPAFDLKCSSKERKIGSEGAEMRHNLSVLWIVSVALEKMTWGFTQKSISRMGPCSFPLPFTRHFELFCQTDYHKTPYVCDPGGILSRTEVELVHKTVSSLNMTSCFCDGCSPAAMRISILLVPAASMNSINECDPTYVGRSISTSAILYAQFVASRWKASCEPDILLVYIQSWRNGDQRYRGPMLVPIFGRRLIHLRRFSTPVTLSSRDVVIVSLQNALHHAGRLISADSTPSRAAIPSWALTLSLALIVVVVCAVHFANCITTRIGQRTDKQKTAILKKDKFRAGFGGGMMMNSQQQQKKSVMLFRTFSKPQKQDTCGWKTAGRCLSGGSDLTDLDAVNRAGLEHGNAPGGCLPRQLVVDLSLSGCLPLPSSAYHYWNLPRDRCPFSFSFFTPYLVPRLSALIALSAFRISLFMTTQEVVEHRQYCTEL